MSVSLSAERERIQRQVDQLEQSLSATPGDLDLLSSETDEDSDGDTEDEVRQDGAGLLAQRDQIQAEIQNLEHYLGPHSPVCVSDDDISSSDESDLGLSLSVDSCLQMNLVYQQVVQETLNQLETLLTNNHRQQKELLSQLSGPIKESSNEQPASTSYQQPISMYLGRFLKPYFKDKLTGLGPPPNQETKEKASRMTGCLDDKSVKVKRWESWQKNLLIHAVTRDRLRRLIQPKLSKLDYMTQKLKTANQTDGQQLRDQIDSLERDIELLRVKKDDELIGGRHEDHDWQKISNIDFEGTRDGEDIRCFWQNFLHPSVNKSRWNQEEVNQLKEISRRHKETHWENIAQQLGTGRTAFMCLQTFQRSVSTSLKRSSWNATEDDQLRELVDKMRIGNFIPYTQMSYFMKGRDPAQLIYRWNQVLDPSLKKGPWTKDEDKLLLQAVHRHGEKNWWKIKMEVPGRTDGACRDRYLDSLKVGTKRGGFDEHERQLLVQLVEKHGVGRWAKIAAEIPNRFDAQCLREWRKLSKPPAQKKPRAKRSESKEGTKKKAKRNIKKRLMKIKEEDSSEEEEFMLEYLDSDDEKKRKKKMKTEVVEVERTEVVEVESTEEVERTEEVETIEEVEKEEKQYTFPPMQDWISAEKAQCLSFLSFQPVILQSSSGDRSGEPVRSTILGQFGCSVIIGPKPRVLQWEERHDSSTMMMVSSNQLRTYLCNRANGFKKSQSGKCNQPGRVTDAVLQCQLQAAVTPWIGNLLIPAKARLTVADALRERGEKVRLTSTVFFEVFLQTLNVDTVGCKEMIEQRRSKVVLLTPSPRLPPGRLKDPKKVSGMLQQKRMREMQQDLDLKHKPVLEHLQLVQQKQVQSQKQLLLLQPPPPRLLCTPPQNLPGFRPQMPPTTHPQMVPLPVLRTVFLPRPGGASIRPVPTTSLATPPSAPHTLPPGGVVPSPSPAAPPVSVAPMLPNATSTTSLQEAGPSTQTLTTDPPTSSNQPVSFGSSVTNQLAVPSSLTNPHPPTITEVTSLAPPSEPTAPTSQNLSLVPTNQHAPSSTSILPTPVPCDHDYTLLKPSSAPIKPLKASPRGRKPGRKRRRRGEQSGTGDSEDGASAAVIQSKKRVRKGSQKAKDLQEATDATVTPPPVDSAPAPPLKASPRRRRGEQSGTGDSGDGASAGVIQNGKRVRKPSQKALDQQEATKAKTEAKKRSPASPGNRPVPQLSGLTFLPGQPMWVMIAGGLVQVTLLPKDPHPPPPGSVSSLQSVPVSPAPPLPPPKLFLPYRGGIRADPAAPPPLRREALQFNPSLMFQEPRAEVCDWLSGRGGVLVPGLGVSLPYLPPFISSLNTLSELLRAQKSLTKSSLQLLNRYAEPRKPTAPAARNTCSPTAPAARNTCSPTAPAARNTCSTPPPPHLPDSTTDPTPAGDRPDPPPEEEAELVVAVRQLVTERFAGNAAYKMLKARFLSCFTVPALLATVQPITEKTATHPANEEEEEEEDEEEEELKRFKERVKNRRAKKSELCDESGAAANQHSGISEPSGPAQTPTHTHT
ncbi:snRNA-activating protein complex subunit 4 [Scomber scombrus]|uniref:snRNA-activating protein complex subunit 4 n=1 Tax=Scomber scombrus TaxID=13677 RepID=UPI002DD8BC02|nr:snRNA-activating protein complex subunit 4 [Scomber scombrus]